MCATSHVLEYVCVGVLPQLRSLKHFDTLVATRWVQQPTLSDEVSNSLSAWPKLIVGWITCVNFEKEFPHFLHVLLDLFQLLEGANVGAFRGGAQF